MDVFATCLQAGFNYTITSISRNDVGCSLFIKFDPVISPVECLAGEHPVLVTDTRVVNDQVRVEVVPRCAPCPLNTYQEHVGGAQCQSCPLDHITITTGSTSRDNCIGMYFNHIQSYTVYN